MADSTAKPSLLVLTSTYPRWEGDHEPGFVHYLATHLTGRFRVLVLAPHAEGALDYEVMSGVEVHRFRYAPTSLQTLVNNGGIMQNLRKSPWKWLLVPGFVLCEAWTAMRLVRKYRPAVLHAHWLVPQGVVAAGLRHFFKATPPYVLTSHGADLFALKGRLWGRVRRGVAKQASAVTVVSTAMRDALERDAVPVENVLVEPMGTDLSTRFTPAPEMMRAGTLLFVGRLVPKKGLRVLLDALPLVLREKPDATLLVVGFGPELDALRAHAREVGIAQAVEFVGAVNHAALPDYYRQAEVFIAPFVEAPDGDQEGLGLVAVEAIGCGCKVVISDLPATRVFEPANGALARVPPGDTVALATAILSMLRSGPVTGTIDVGRFDWHARAAAYGDILQAAACPRH